MQRYLVWTFSDWHYPIIRVALAEPDQPVSVVNKRGELNMNSIFEWTILLNLGGWQYPIIRVNYADQEGTNQPIMAKRGSEGLEKTEPGVLDQIVSDPDQPVAGVNKRGQFDNIYTRTNLLYSGGWQYPIIRVNYVNQEETNLPIKAKRGGLEKRDTSKLEAVVVEPDQPVPLVNKRSGLNNFYK